MLPHLMKYNDSSVSGLCQNAKNTNTKWEECIKTTFEERLSKDLVRNTEGGSLHADVKGAVETRSLKRSKYVLTAVDKNSSFVFVRHLRIKDQAS